ncbi:Calcium-binding EF hand family protein, putative isoform 2 [Hibiscus syriacus]|uniref:Calcium-binding EF hand family protein, putative isoform 2 n=1 Tax=Hibiscus syriacus TaxID=106335 RepID=A0A6A2YHT1_HIBSY|nr:uncharacterized protein LOC120167017 [Hibiscus syriacus]KAE8675587.1 Calcium-binding EF hand family protein, putative isoform 2 [Hibiscus syriacus]
MEKAMVYTFLAIAFMVLLSLFSRQRSHHHPMGLNHRLAHKVSFDAMVLRIERWTKDKGPDKNISYVPYVEDARGYFQDDGTSNTMLRLMILFPLLDNASKDCKINAEELGVWITQQVVDRMRYRTDNKEMAWHDKNRDGAINVD